MPTVLPVSPPHRWKFFRAGGLDQVRLDSGSDLVALPDLDQKLWVALSCPVNGLEFDEKTLALIDGDKDGHIRAPEVLAAVEWAVLHLKDPGSLLAGGDALPLDAINASHESGKNLLASAREILRSLGKAGAPAISVADTADTVGIFSQTKFNGDGIVPASSAEDEATAKVIQDILATLGGKPDRSGQTGVDQAGVDQFFAELQNYADWWRQSAAGGGTGILPLGNKTPAAYDALKAVRNKIEDYFARCRLAAFDARAAAPLNRSEAEYVALAPKDLSSLGDEIASLPLAQAGAARPLSLTEGLNPAWTASIARFRREVIAPLHGDAQTTLTDAEWTALLARFSAFEAWMLSKQGSAVEKLGLDRIKTILESPAKASLAQLIARDLALAPEMAAIDAVDRLARYHRDLCRLLGNFVNFQDFYSPARHAIFQAGTLYLDGRACDLCILVADMAKHASLAGLSKCYLAYCDCTRKGAAEKMTIVAAFTGGDSDNLMAGRNGVFYDRQGRDWDATIIKVVENPISIRQAIWAPYKRVARMIDEQIEKFAAAKDKAVLANASTGISSATAGAAGGKPAAPPPFDVAKFAGIFAAIGLAIGAIGGALAALAGGFFRLEPWQMPLAIIAVFVIISGPSMLLAALKLRQRNLGPILDANGWAVNARVKINIPFGTALTSVARLPLGAERSLVDPYAGTSGKKIRCWIWTIVVLLALATGIFVYWVNHRRVEPVARPAHAVRAQPAPGRPAPRP